MRMIVCAAAAAVVMVGVCSYANANPLSPMNEYNLIVFGDLDSQSNVQGKAFIGGNLSGTASDFGTMLSIPSSETSLLVGGDVLATIENINRGSIEVGGDISAGSTINMNSGGSAAVGGTVFGTVQNGPVVPLGSPVDISGIQSTLEAASAALAALSANSTTSVQNGNQLVFDAQPGGPQNQAVFNVTAADVFENNSLAQMQMNANGASQIIINVSGSSMTWNNGMNQVGAFTSNALREIVVWNFYEATSLTVDRNLNGALLAPDAHLTNSTNIDGSVAVASFTQRGEVHLPTTAVAVPEASSLVLMSLGLLTLAPFFRRRIKR